MLISNDYNFSNNYNKYTPVSFRARVPLKTCAPLCEQVFTEKTPFDILFSHNKVSKRIEALTLYLQTNFATKYAKTDKQNVFARSFYKMMYVVVGWAKKLSPKVFYLENCRSIDRLTKKLSSINPNSGEYIEELARIGNSLDKKFIVTNVENNPLKDIAKSNDATIFVLNHPHYHRDRFTYTIINSLLSKLYVQEGLQATCPRPRIIASQSLLKDSGPHVGELYKHLGFVPVDAALQNRDAHSNTNSMRRLLSEFVKNKANVFIFPEGRNCVKNLPLEQRVQPGVASFVSKALKLKSSVRIIPVGIKYDNNIDSFGNLYFGKPIYLKQKGDSLVYTHGTDKRTVERAHMLDSIPIIFKEICDSLNFCISKANILK